MQNIYANIGGIIMTKIEIEVTDEQLEKIEIFYY